MSAPSAINNMRDILVGATPSTNTITTGDLNSAAFKASTNVGEIACFSKEGTRLTEATAATATEFVIAVSRGSALPPLVSDVIVKSSIKGAIRKVYAAATEQSVAIGYNGTSGSILDTAVYAGDVYTVKMILQQFLSGSDDERIKRGDYKSLTTDGQSEVALGVVKSLNLNMAREVKNSAGNPPVIATALCNDAGVANAIPAGADYTHFKVTNGSKFVVGTDSAGVQMLGSDETNANILVSTYFRAGTATSTAVYKVVAVTAGTGTTPAGTPFSFELSHAYTGADAIIAVASTEYITSALGAAADWGVVLTGQPLPWSISKKKYAKVRLAVQPNSSFGSTVMSTISSASEGTGTYEQVAELENFLQGFKGEQYEMGQPYLFDDATNLRLASSAVTGGGYDLITFSHSSTVSNFTTDVANKEVVIAVPATVPNYADTANALDDLSDVLEVLAGLGTTALEMT
jgi:hypothetical protein